MIYIKYFKIENEKIPYKLIKESRKSISLLWHRKKECFKYKVPHWISKKDLKNFVKKNKDKILKKYRVYNKNYKTGKKIKYLDKKYILDIKIKNGFNSFYSLKDNKLELYPEEKNNKKVKELLHDFYKKRAEIFIPSRIDIHSRHIGISYNKIKLKNQKTLWGSASSKRNININYRLMMAPVKILDYVLIHELIHLKYMNHSIQFWNELSKYEPEYKKKEHWLKKNRYNLII